MFLRRPRTSTLKGPKMLTGSPQRTDQIEDTDYVTESGHPTPDRMTMLKVIELEGA